MDSDDVAATAETVNSEHQAGDCVDQNVTTSFVDVDEVDSNCDELVLLDENVDNDQATESLAVNANVWPQVEIVEVSSDVSDIEANESNDVVVCHRVNSVVGDIDNTNNSDVLVEGQRFSWGLGGGQRGTEFIADSSLSSSAVAAQLSSGDQFIVPSEAQTAWPFTSELKQPINNIDISRSLLDEESITGESIEGSKPFESSWPCSEQCSRSQSPMSYVIQLNEDSECSLQSLPPGESRCTGFNMALSQHIPVVHETVQGTDSQTSNAIQRADNVELLLEVETGSNLSEAVSGKDGNVMAAELYGTVTSDTPDVCKAKVAEKKVQFSAAKSRIRKRVLVSVTTEIGANDGHPSSPSVFEYQWPLYDKSADWFLLQEHISEFLGVLSFKRKYPDIYRRVVDINERQYLMDSGAVTEMQCDLGLTALLADEVYDIMERDYPEKFQEYTKVIHKKEKQKVAEQLRAAEVIPTEKNKLETLMKKSIKSAAEFNSQLMRELRHERKACFDLQTNELHYPYTKVKVLPAELTKIGSYPVALLPGQFQDYYKRYSAVELNYFPVNTALYSPHKSIPSVFTDSSVAQTVAPTDGTDYDDDKPSNLTTAVVDTSVAVVTSPDSDTVTQKQSHDLLPVLLNKPIIDTPTPPKLRCVAAHKKTPATTTIEQQLSVASTAAKCTSCGQTELNKLDAEEEMVCCSACSRSSHPTCLELTKEMIPIIKTYEWQCMECKTCVKCMKAHDEEKMMFCDHCDRGYHTFCVGLKVIPAGRWECASCTEAAAVSSLSPPKPKRGRPFKYPRPPTAVPSVQGLSTPVATEAASAQV